MKKSQVIKQILNAGVVAVIRAESKKQGIKIIDAVIKGGIRSIEITMTVPGAIDIIKELSESYTAEEALIGAGTVLDPETARACMLAGADFIVSPNLNVDTLKICNRYAVTVIPGIMTVKEAIEALEYGVDIIKVFPGNVFGPSVISSFNGPLPQANFMPTGGVSLSNVEEWINAGAVAVGTGGELTKGAKTGDYEAVKEMATKFVAKVNSARSI